MSFTKYCHNCKFFIKKIKNNDDISKCSKFTIKLKDNYIINYFARFARDNKNMCGQDGKHYESK